MSYVYVLNSKPVVHFPLVDLGWWVTILWMVGDHPGWGWWLTILDTSPGLHFESQVYVQNSKSVVHFLMVHFGWLVTTLGMVGVHPGDGG